MNEEVEEKKLKKSFWKDKKNVAIVILSFLLFCVSVGSSGDPATSANTSNLKSEMNVVVNEKTELSEKLDKAQDKIRYLSSELEAKEQSNKETEEKIVEYEKQIENLKAETDNLKTQVQELTESKNSLETKVNTLTTENSNLKAKSQTVSAAVSTQTQPVAQSAQPSSSYTVYITNTGSKYHRDGCSYLKSKNAIDKNDAIARGYTPCSRCNP